MLTAEDAVWDVIIIGGGPAGALSGLALARLGRRAIILEKATFPRFHIGESFLPSTLDLLKEWGLEAEFRKLPHMRKFGAEFAMGYGGKILDIDFDDGFCAGGKETFNVERAVFDNFLLRAAEQAGIAVRENVSVKQISKLTDGDARVVTDTGEEIRGRYIFDASGQNTVIARHLGTKKTMDDPKLQKIAYFGPFENVERAVGRKAGNPLITMMEEGWFWLIPTSPTRTSVGMVMDAEVARRITRDQGIPPEKMLQWGINACPLMRERMRVATGDANNFVLADFSFRNRPYAGEGYFLVGDSAAFMDPIFSTGVCVAGNAAQSAAGLLDEILSGKTTPDRARTVYIKQIESCTSALFKLIRQYYDHSFRELFLQGKGPMGVHKAIIGLLSGNVFPRPPLKIRWRVKLFDFFVERNRKRRLVPRRRPFSVVKSAMDSETMAMAEQST